MVKQMVGYAGEIVFATGKPDGTLRKLLDVGCLTGFGCQPAIGLSEGV
jgi:GDP-L-fucose synthase